MARRLGLLLLLAVLVPATTASAAPRSAAAAKLLTCDATKASATFESVMRAVPGTKAMSVKFKLQARPAGGRWSSVDAPGFGRWVTAQAGKTRFVYDKTITKLPASSDYRVVVGFRWRDAEGATLDRTTRRSPACEQPDTRPDLRPVALERTMTGWVLTVVNAGGGAAGAVPATLSTGTTEARGTIRPLQPGADTGVYFEGVACAPGDTLTATVDPDDDLDEADESGNTISLPCPASPTS